MATPQAEEELPGVEGEGVSRKSIKAVDNAFDELLSARKRRMDWGEKEGEAQTKLLDLMHKHNLKVYYFDDQKYERKQFEKVIRAKKDPALAAVANGDGEEE